MTENTIDCDTCAEGVMVPVRDDNMIPEYRQGNKYFWMCKSCGRKKFCGGEYWRNADTKYAIPQGEDPKVENAVHHFNCPECEEERYGFPDACADCGAEYEWPDEVNERWDTEDS